MTISQVCILRDTSLHLPRMSRLQKFSTADLLRTMGCSTHIVSRIDEQDLSFVSWRWETCSGGSILWTQIAKKKENSELLFKSQQHFSGLSSGLPSCLELSLEDDSKLVECSDGICLLA